jgi:hypothetical protein
VEREIQAAGENPQPVSFFGMRASHAWCVIACIFGSACGGSDVGGSGTPCVLPGDCPQGEVCENGTCVTGTSCTTADDCDPGEVCSAGGVCIPEGTCLDDRDCRDSDFCSANGTCIPDGTCAVDDDCLPGMRCDANHTCVPGGDCGATEVAIEPIPPNMLIVLDRSCSMTGSVMGTPKWTSAVTAVNQLTTNFNGDIRWGLTLFPDTVTPNCGQAATIPIPVAPGNESMIQTLLTNSLATNDVNYPDGPCVTNIDSAMQQAATETALDDPMRKSFVMLITDGMQSGCSLAGGDNGTEMIISNLNMMRDVKTFVVGFGGATDTAQMDQFAINGGTAQATSPRYYQADNAMELEMALATIADLVIGCDFVLTNPPADLTELFAFFNNTISVPRDPTHMNGWDYDPTTMTLTFYGGFCDQLSSGQVTDVDIVYGCAGPTPD